MSARHVTRAGLGALVLAATCAAPAASSAATEPLSAPGIVAHFKQSAKQAPENFTLLPNGDFDVAFSSAHQVARVTPRGATKVLATLPVPANGGTKTPELGAAATAGIERAPNGTVYFTYSTGTAGLTGIWRLNGHRAPTRIAKLPGAHGAHAFLNGLALDPRTNTLYATDTAAGVVWRVPTRGGTATKWASGKQLKQVDGLKIHNGAVWVGSASSDKLAAHSGPGRRQGRRASHTGDAPERCTAG